jgi:hypothetical protein
MTPKEKAEELVEKYLRIEDDTTFYWVSYWNRRMIDDEVLTHAKRCALIAVDEIEIVLLQERIFESFDYWKAVKQEIEKL